MEASWARAQAQEKKHFEKMQRKQAEADAKVKSADTEKARALLGGGKAAAAAPKYTKKLIATSEKRQQIKAAKLAELEGEEAESAEAQIEVRRDDGRSVPFSMAVADIHAFLKLHGSEASLVDVHKGTGVDPAQSLDLLEALRRNPRIEAVANGSGGEFLKYAPPYGVRNRGSLAHLLSRAHPGSGEHECVPRSSLVAAETYDGLDVDVDELLQQGRCVKLDVSDRSRRDYVLFAAPRGRSAIEEVRKLWADVRVPQGLDLQQALVRSKRRTQEEIDRRGARKAEDNRRQQEAKKGTKRSRVGAIRGKWANAHLGTKEELEEMFARTQQ